MSEYRACVRRKVVTYAVKGGMERLASIGVDSGSMVQWFLPCVVRFRYVEYIVSNLSYGLK